SSVPEAGHRRDASARLEDEHTRAVRERLPVAHGGPVDEQRTEAVTDFATALETHAAHEANGAVDVRDQLVAPVDDGVPVAELHRRQRDGVERAATLGFV